MTKQRTAKERRLAHEILGLIGISGALALALFVALVSVAMAIAENYCFYNDVPMTEFDWMEVDRWIFGTAAVVCGCFFSLLFLGLLADRMAYIRKITEGIDALGRQQAQPLPLEGSNELTRLAGAVNDMALAQQLLRQQEQTLAQEKEQFVRALSHDIRTPLTSILAYSDYLASAQLPEQERQAHLLLIRKKAEQIRDLTDLLLDGGKRNLEHFADGHLLMEQLVAEFEAELEEDFTVISDLTGCPAFAGSFDVQELRRVFDNLSSNVRKYADPTSPVRLWVSMADGCLQIRQSNAVAQDAPEADGYQLGLRSIRRIAQSYDGQVAVEQGNGTFVIAIQFFRFL